MTLLKNLGSIFCANWILFARAVSSSTNFEPDLPINGNTVIYCNSTLFQFIKIRYISCAEYQDLFNTRYTDVKSWFLKYSNKISKIFESRAGSKLHGFLYFITWRFKSVKYKTSETVHVSESTVKRISFSAVSTTTEYSPFLSLFAHVKNKCAQ